MPNDRTAAPKLVDIPTDVPDLMAAHADDSPEQARAAQARIYKRYEKAISGYLRAILLDANAAEELLSEFALKLVSGRFVGFEPGRGRFRDYLKSTLAHMVANYWRAKGRWPSAIPDPGVLEDPRHSDLDDARFLVHWREGMISRAWAKLEDRERTTGRPFATVLREKLPREARASFGRPKAGDLWHHLDDEGSPGGARTAAQIAAILATWRGVVVTEVWVRAILMEARHYLEDSLLGEVRDSIEPPTVERVELELIDLGLHAFLAKAVERWKRGEQRRRVGPIPGASVRSDSPARSASSPLGSGASAPRS